MDSPRPVPPYSLAMVASVCLNSVKRLSILSGGDADAGVGDAIDEEVALQRRPRSRPFPALVNLSELPARFIRHCVMRPASPCASGMSAGTAADELQPLVRRQRPQRRAHALHRVLHRVVRQRELHAPGLDLGEVEHVVDEAQQVLAARLDVGERLLQVGRHLAVDLAEDHLVEAEDGVQRRAQLVAHAGEELATCAGSRPRAAGPSPRSRGTAARSGSPAPTGSRRSSAASTISGANAPGVLPLTRQRADDVLLAQQRHGEQRAVAAPHQRLAAAALR